MKRVATTTVYDKNSLAAALQAPGGLVSGTTTGIPAKPSRPSPQLIDSSNGHLKSSNSNAKIATASSLPKVQSLLLIPHRRHLHMKNNDISAALNKQIDEYGELYARALGITFAELGNPLQATPTPIITVGRIVASNKERKVSNSMVDLSMSGLNGKGHSFLLESSRQLGSGCRVTLDLSQVTGPLYLFPGQIVCLEGLNMGHGRAFQVLSQKMPLLQSPSLLGSMPDTSIHTTGGPIANSRKSDNNEMGFEDSRNTTCNVLIAAGPFTAITGERKVDFQPLESLLQFALERRPDVLIFMGPFIPCHDVDTIPWGETVSPVELFRRDFMGRVRVLAQRLPQLCIVLVPSPLDLLAELVFPQPASNVFIEGMEQPHQQQFMTTSNPTIISVGGIKIGISVAELLTPLASMAAFYNSSSSVDPLYERLAKMVVQQNSFYPLLPTHPTVPLDYTQLAQLAIHHSLDIFINPSQLRCFATSKSGPLFINPGLFADNSSGSGTLALLQILPRGSEYKVDFYQF